ncbi:MAG TPA: alpha/beta fold hydrolase [Polyangiaceae bacterium]|nr:alpha/beta fold hydrolase [Polyangiaceae bacterium]
MASFVLIPGAGGMAWYWHRVVPLLALAGHEAIAVDLPGEDALAGLDAYADAVVRAIGARANVVLVAQSLGGFTAPLVCAGVPVRKLVFVNAMIPQPGETAGEWWGNTGAAGARADAAERGGYSVDFDVATYCLHDVPEAVLHGAPNPREEVGAAFEQPCRFRAWPRVPIRVLAGADDRFFPLSFQREVARARLDADVHAVRGGHLVALSNPDDLVARLLAFEHEI